MGRGRRSEWKKVRRKGKIVGRRWNEGGLKARGNGTRDEEMVSLKQSRWLVALDRNPVYRIMIVCPCTSVSVRAAVHTRVGHLCVRDRLRRGKGTSTPGTRLD